MERRGAERYEASSTIEYSSAECRGEAQIIDLSLAGCRLRGLAESIARGDELALSLPAGMTATGTVCWIEDSLAGVKFAVPISMATLDYFRFADGITVTDDADFDRFGRRLPPLGARASSSL